MGRDVMGSIIGWHCSDCGAGESFYCGGGMMGFNEPAAVEHSKDGTFGPAMKRLLGDGIPEGWTVFAENVFYRCPNCDGVISGGALRIDDRSGGWLTFHIKPDVCETCNEELIFWDDKVPMSESELLARCEGYVESGCPKCGGTNVSVDAGNWD